MMTQFEIAVECDIDTMIAEGKMVAIEETSSFCPTIFLIGMEDGDGNFPFIAYDYYDRSYCGMGVVTPEEYAEHYKEALLMGAKIWEREEDE